MSCNISYETATDYEIACYRDDCDDWYRKLDCAEDFIESLDVGYFDDDYMDITVSDNKPEYFPRIEGYNRVMEEYNSLCNGYSDMNVVYMKANRETNSFKMRLCTTVYVVNKLNYIFCNGEWELDTVEQIAISKCPPAIIDEIKQKFKEEIEPYL